MNKFRSHNCGELSLKNDGNVVHLSGWVNKKRDHGGLLFVDLRDHYGLTQCVFDSNIKNFETIESLKLESVLKIIGKTFDEQTVLNIAYSMDEKINYKNNITDWWME